MFFFLLENLTETLTRMSVSLPFTTAYVDRIKGDGFSREIVHLDQIRAHDLSHHACSGIQSRRPRECKPMSIVFRLDAAFASFARPDLQPLLTAWASTCGWRDCIVS